MPVFIYFEPTVNVHAYIRIPLQIYRTRMRLSMYTLLEFPSNIYDCGDTIQFYACHSPLVNVRPTFSGS